MDFYGMEWYQRIQRKQQENHLVSNLMGKAAAFENILLKDLKNDTFSPALPRRLVNLYGTTEVTLLLACAVFYRGREEGFKAENLEWARNVTKRFSYVPEIRLPNIRTDLIDFLVSKYRKEYSMYSG